MPYSSIRAINFILSCKISRSMEKKQKPSLNLMVLSMNLKNFWKIQEIILKKKDKVESETKKKK